jgi:hypothetical protein
MPNAEFFESEAIEDVHRAFDAACAELGSAITSDKATELVATKIAELAKAGIGGPTSRRRLSDILTLPRTHSPGVGKQK